jgi:hypothetical protein
MSTEPGGATAFQTWRAEDWDHLRAIWTSLYPREGEPSRFGPDLLTPQQAGWVFERWILEAFRLSGVVGHYPFGNRRVNEQIDGLLFEGWQGFLIESKFKLGKKIDSKPRTGRKIDIGPIYRLHILVEQRLAGALGLFFAAFGYTLPAIEKARSLRPTRVLLFEASDLNWALEQPGSMMTMVRRKWIRALKDGDPHAPIAEPIDLFGGSSSHAIS